MPGSKGESLKFKIFTDFLEKLEGTTKRLQMTDYLVELFKMLLKEDLDKAIYLMQGKLYPDYAGVELGLAEKMAIKALVATTGRSEKEVELNLKKIGDLGLAAEEMLGKKSQLTLYAEPLTVRSVYESLDRIAHATGSGSVDVKIRLLCSLLNSATPREAKYIFRIALSKLRLGVADMTILDALALAFGGGKEAREELERAYNLSSDLGLVAKTVGLRGVEGVRHFKVVVSRPIRPMLCERLSTPSEILEKLGGRGSAEYKYDGLRIQAHISGGKVTLFSRRLENITSQFPDVCSYLVKRVRAKEVIVECEAVAVDSNTGDMLPFQMISQRRGRKYEIEAMAKEIPVVIYLFDLLYLNGVDFTLKPYLERRSNLRKIVDEDDHVKISEQLITDSPAELEKYFDQAVSSGCEGLVVKRADAESVYQAGARGWLWIKYKRSYKAEVADTFDLVPVGAFYGRGRRAGTYGALLMAAYNSEEDSFETICKLGSGFTDEDLGKLPEEMKPYVVAHRHARVNSLMQPDVWFTPVTVMEVAADEITLSPLHTCCRGEIKKDSGLALRFPRFTGSWRKDRSPEDATATKEIIEMYRGQLKKIGEEPKTTSITRKK